MVATLQKRMRVVLISGLGPGRKHDWIYDGSLFDPDPTHRSPELNAIVGENFQLTDLMRFDGHGYVPLLVPRPIDDMPHLTTVTLGCILERAGVDFDIVRLPDIWNGTATKERSDYDAILLSTTFMWNSDQLVRARQWINDQFPRSIPRIIGGQFSNLKYASIIANDPAVDVVVRFNAHDSLPRLLRELQAGGDLSQIPNLVYRQAGRRMITAVDPGDFASWPSPTFPGQFKEAPYIATAGCPHNCYFCAFPSANMIQVGGLSGSLQPHWQYLSPERIYEDFARLHDQGVRRIVALDSTFTIPRDRVPRLCEMLIRKPLSGLEIQIFARMNQLFGPWYHEDQIVQMLWQAGFTTLNIGCESMYEGSLKAMNKRVTAEQNKKGLEMLAGVPEIYANCSFIIGYPPETEQQYNDWTRTCLERWFQGRFAVNPLEVTDQVMPLWEHVHENGLTVDDPNDPESGWKHNGMTSDIARQLMLDTIDDVRRKNPRAVHNLWQSRYRKRLIPGRNAAYNLEVEKRLEWIAMIARDYPDVYQGRERLAGIFHEFRNRYGIVPGQSLRIGFESVVQPDYGRSEQQLDG